MYLGLVLEEHLNFNVTASFVAQSASRALGLLISKYKAIGGMPYRVYTKLYDSLVWSIVAYGAAIWGTQTFSCIEAVHNRAMRVYLGTTRNTPTAAMAGDMGWQPVHIRQILAVSNYWIRLSHMSDTRCNKKIFLYCVNAHGPGCKNWCFRVLNNYAKIGCYNKANVNIPIVKNSFLNEVKEQSVSHFILDWNTSINSERGRSNVGGNKLRTYKLFKQSFETEPYCKIILPRSHRSAFSRFRCGVAPIRLETGRYERLSVSERVCPFCANVVENELHVMLKCPLYNDIRQYLFEKAVSLDVNFSAFTVDNKLVYVFQTPDLIRITAKTCFLILQRRSSYLYR